MRLLLDQLSAEVQRVNPDAAASLRPGLPRDLIVEKISALPFQISPGALALYEWADGSVEGFELLPGAYFFPLEEALAHCETINGIRDELEAIAHEPFRDCFRFLSDLSNGGYAFGRLDSPSAGQVVGLCIDAPWRIAFPCLERLVETAIACFREDVYGKEPCESPDFQKYFRIGARLNPGLDYWLDLATEE